MASQLVIDIGNTRVKAAVFEQKQMIRFFVLENTAALLNSDIFKTNSITSCIVGSVVNEIGDFLTQLKQIVPVLMFDSGTPVPLKNLYRSAHTLGSDRLAAAVGAYSIAPGENTLVIDTGTCIKYNFVTNNNEYIGGAISPGLQMRLKAMNTFTARLPLLTPDPDFMELIGTDSNESILSGAQNGAAAEVDGFINQYRQRFNNLKVFLTGGDFEFFAKRLKNPIFADQFLILKGLNEILIHNKNSK